MTVRAEFSLPLSAVPTGRVLREHPAARLEVEPIVPTGGETLPFVWLWAPDPEPVAAAVRATPAVAGLTQLYTVDDGALYRIAWTPDENEALCSIVDIEGISIVAARSGPDDWHVTVRALEHEHLARFQEHCRENEIPFEAVSVSQGGEQDRDSVRLTAAQREALELALEEGYFESPRESSLSEMAGLIGISRQALAGRLRRGHRALLRRTLRGDSR